MPSPFLARFRHFM